MSKKQRHVGISANEAVRRGLIRTHLFRVVFEWGQPTPPIGQLRAGVYAGAASRHEEIVTLNASRADSPEAYEAMRARIRAMIGQVSAVDGKGVAIVGASVREPAIVILSAEYLRSVWIDPTTRKLAVPERGPALVN